MVEKECLGEWEKDEGKWGKQKNGAAGMGLRVGEGELEREESK